MFASHTGRRIVLATNVAETSLTVPGIRYVVDSGVARISRYSARTKVQRLPIEAISQASAQQRSGRCGRVEAGIAIRLYSEEDFESRPLFTDPEILRTNLASVILQMTSLAARRDRAVPVRGAAGQAHHHRRRPAARGARSARDRRCAPPRRREVRLTKVGQRLARLPIDPRLGRMILEAERLGVLRDVLVIAAVLSLQDPRERPVEQRQQADQQHARFTDKTSDFLTWLNLWRYLREQQRELSGSAFRRMCKREHLNYLRVREWQDFESQLRQVCKEMGIQIGKPAEGVDSDGIHQALLAGLLSHIGLLEERDRQGDAALASTWAPATAGSRSSPAARSRAPTRAYLMAGELVETGRLWARQNAAIKPEWAEQVGAHLVKRTYSEPHWSKKRAAVMAYERVTLYGVPLVADRLVQYGRIDQALSREMFIRHALVYGEWSTHQKFYRENLRLLEEAEELEHRARRRDLVVDEHTLFDFYDARIGPEVVSGAHFDTWWKQARRAQPDLLTFDPEMLTHENADEVREADYPQTWEAEGLTFPISYVFQPGTAEDGLTIDVPVATLNRVEADDFSWNVPGLREELVTSLLRSLPKNLRVSFVPAPNTAKEFLARGAGRRRGAARRAGALPALDDRRGRAARGLGLGEGAGAPAADLPGRRRRRLRAGPREGPRGAEGTAPAGVRRRARRGRLGRGAVGDRADDLDLRHGRGVGRPAAGRPRGARLPRPRRRGHHASGSGCSARPTRPRPDTDSASDACSCWGCGPSTRSAGLDNAAKLGLAGSPYPTVAELVDDVRAAVAGFGGRRAPAGARPGVVRRARAGARRRRWRSGSPRSSPTCCGCWPPGGRPRSGSAVGPSCSPSPRMQDMRAQVGRLVDRGFVGEAGPEQLRRYPTYLAAVEHRRERLDSQVAKDAQLMMQVADVQEAYLNQVAALPAGRPPGAALRRVRWMLEEYRVSLWAQQLGTAYSVSDQRIRKALHESATPRS